MEVVSEIRARKLYQIGAGEGRNSTVYLAHDPQLDGNIALKEIPISQFSNPDEYFAEARRLYASRHPRVVPVLYAGSDSEYVRIGMPHFPKGSLQSYLATEGVPTVRHIITWGQEFLLGLHHIHTLGLIHFDVKPSNILLWTDGSAMISDFGQTRPTNSLGVAQLPPLYRYHFPPEACSQDAATKHADIYQAGLTLYRLCNGESMFRSQLPDMNRLVEAICSGRFPNRGEFLPHVPGRLRRVIRKALAVSPSERYRTAMEMREALGQVDSLLDWKYSSLASGQATWTMETTNHTYSIELTQVADGSWLVVGSTTNLYTGKRRARNEWSGGPFRSRRQALRHLESVFRRLESR